MTRKHEQRPAGRSRAQNVSRMCLVCGRENPGRFYELGPDPDAQRNGAADRGRQKADRRP